MALRGWDRRDIARGVRLLLEEADVRGLLRLPAWSIAELELGGDNYEALQGWLEGLQYGPAERLVASGDSMGMAPDAMPFSEAEGIGLLLLALTAEAARRQVDSGEVWPALARQTMQGKTRNALLAPSGQPRGETRRSISAAAARFGLRSAQDGGGQAWYRTVVLQFGFSRQGFEQQLPRWLERGLPESLQPLLDARQHAAGFAQTWNALRRHRGGELHADDVRDVLEASPWLLPGWVDSLIGAASRTVEETSALGLLGGLRLRWDGTRALLEARPATLTGAELTASSYRLLVDGESCTKLLRGGDGAYGSTREVVELAPASSLSIVLVDRAGSVVREEVLELWEPDSHATVFSASGARLGERAPMPKDEATLVYRSKATIQPEPLARAPFGERDAARVRPRSWEELELCWPDGERWTTEHRRSSPVAIGVTAVDVASPGGEVTLQLGLGPGESVATVVHPEGWEPSADGLAISGTLPVDATNMWRGRARLANGSTRTVGGRLRLRGCTVRRRGEWSLPQAAVDRSDLRRLSWRVFADEEPRGDALILAGAHVVKRLKRFGAATVLGSAPGYGEPLQWVDAQIFSQDAPLAHPLVESIVDHGEVREAALVAGDLELQIASELAPDEASVMVWTHDGLRRLDPRAIHAADERWTLALEGARPVAALISFGEARVGAWWANDWASHLDALADQIGAEMAALFLRVARLPVLERGSAAEVRRLFRRHPPAAVRAWLLDRTEYTVALRGKDLPVAEPSELFGPLSMLLDADTSEPWWATVSELFVSDHNPLAVEDDDDADQVTCTLGQVADADGAVAWSVAAALQRVSRISPAWTRQLLQADAATYLRQPRVLRRLCLDVANLHDEASVADLDRVSSSYVARAAQALRVDTHRLRALATDLQTPTPLAVRLALQHATFRDAANLMMLKNPQLTRPS